MGRHAGQRHAPVGATLRAWGRRRDQLVWAIRDWRDAVHRARDLLQSVSRHMDNRRKPERFWWTAKVRGALNELGGVLPATSWDRPPAIDDDQVGKTLAAFVPLLIGFAEELKAIGPPPSGGDRREVFNGEINGGPIPDLQSAQRRIRNWVAKDDGIRLWLCDRLREHVNTGLAELDNKQPIQEFDPTDWVALRALTPQRRLLTACEVVVALHDAGWADPVWDSPTWTQGPPGEAGFAGATYDTVAAAGIRYLTRVSADDARAYLRIVQRGWREFGSVSGIEPTGDINGDSQRSKKPPEATRLPKTRRGLQRLLETNVKDQAIVAAIREGQSYRAVGKSLKVGKSTVARVAQSYGLTGHSPETVPVDGTLGENLSIRARSGKRRTP